MSTKVLNSRNGVAVLRVLDDLWDCLHVVYLILLQWAFRRTGVYFGAC